MKTVIYEKTAMLINTRNEQSVECEVDNIRAKESLDAFIAGNKIHMRWNGKSYSFNPQPENLFVHNSYQYSFGVDQRSTAVSGTNAHVGLDEGAFPVFSFS